MTLTTQPSSSQTPIVQRSSPRATDRTRVQTPAHPAAMGRWLVALMLCALAAPAFADAVNGQKLFDGLPSARFPSGSHPCTECHNFGPTDTVVNGANNPAQISSAINLEAASRGAMKPLYGATGTFPLSDADIQDLADYIQVVVHGSTAPTFTATPSSAAFASTAVGAQSATMTFTIANSGASGTLSSVASSNNTEFLLAGGTCLTLPATVPQGGSCTVLVIFKPTVVGARSSTISIIDNGTPNPLVINVTGTATSGGTTGPGTKVTVVEYYDAAFDHYFITPLANEIALCDAGTSPCAGWVRTGRSFNAFDNAAPPASSIGVCRFFNDTFAPKSSHFYALHGLGCEDTIADFPDWQLESSDLFNMYLPDANGNCPSGTSPVYRLYNNGMGGAPNHRFVTSLADRTAMVDKGYVSEGFGALGVGMCAPN